LEQLRSAHARTQGQLQTARAAFEKAMAVKTRFLREKERKTQEAMGAIRDYRRSQWQKKVADVMEQFDVAGISQTHDEMVRKVEETTAVNEARMEMALGNVDQQRLKIDEEAEKNACGRTGETVQGGDGFVDAGCVGRGSRKNDRRPRGGEEPLSASWRTFGVWRIYGRSDRKRRVGTHRPAGCGAGGLQPGQVRRG
jgi:hypothetical protein